LVEVADASRTLAEEAAGRMKAMYALVDQLAQSSLVNDQVIEELTRVQARQCEAVAQAESLDAKMAEFVRRSDEIEQMLRMIAERRVPEAARGEVAAGVVVDSRRGTEVQAVPEQRNDVEALQREVQELMGVASATEQQITADVLQSKAMMTDLLEGARLNLRTASEQKEMVDQLNGRLANVQSVIQEAQTTLRVLNEERELLERIDQSIRQLRTPGNVSDGERGIV
jgi:hypothetical protein